MTETIYTLRKVHTKSFTVLGNEMLRDQGLPLRERGLLATMLSLDDGWRFSVRGLASILYDGESAIKTSLKLLEEKGYLRRERVRDVTGRLTAILYQISDSPIFLDTAALLETEKKAEAERCLQEKLTEVDVDEPEDLQMSLVFPMETPNEAPEKEETKPITAPEKKVKQGAATRVNQSALSRSHARHRKSGRTVRKASVDSVDGQEKSGRSPPS